VSWLHLHLKAQYFDEIQAGTKTEEYRVCSPFYKKRLAKAPERVVLYRGYPNSADTPKIMSLPWRGMEVKTIIHPHFGNVPTEVFAIRVTP
jgi:hypothetical protein